MKRIVLAACLLTGMAPLAWPCWSAIDPGAFAYECPIIVTGTIESVAEAAPGGLRNDDIASIRVESVVRNSLTDIGLQSGDLFQVRMISKNNCQQCSTDLNYPVKTRATWIVMLTGNGQFRIDVHPVQKQPLNAKLGMDEVQKVGGRNKGDNQANPAGIMTTAQWIDRKNRQDAENVRRMAAYNAQQKLMRDLAKAFADAERLDDAIWKRLQESDIDVRRGVLQLSREEQPMSGERFAEFAQGVLAREKDDNVRTHAVSRLAYCRDPSVKGMKVLSEALRDSSPSVRLFACQSVKMRGYQQLADQVKSLQSDPNRQVREMATHTLEYWRSKTK